MRSAAPLLPALLAVALLAGCAAPPPAAEPAPAQAAAATPRSLDWSQADCQSITWSVPVLASSLQPHLPAGFQPSAGEAPAEAPAAPAPAAGQAATLGFRAVECSAGFGERDLLRSVQSGLVYVPVLPPADLREDRFGARYAFGWDVLVASDAWRQAAGGWGLPVRNGGALVGPTAQGWTGAIAMDRVGTFTVTGRTVDGEAAADGHESRTVTLGGQGFALWDAAVQDVRVSTGVGLWTASPESWVAQVVGATQGVATFELATWTMPRASVHWPGEALGPADGRTEASG